MWGRVNQKTHQITFFYSTSGKKEMSSEQTLVEIICTSASLHGVRKQPLRSLEWPELYLFCNYVRNYILTLSAENDDLNGEFIAKEGSPPAASFMLLLISEKTTSALISKLVHIFTKVTTS